MDDRSGDAVPGRRPRRRAAVGLKSSHDFAAIIAAAEQFWSFCQKLNTATSTDSAKLAATMAMAIQSSRSS
ncbi:MAG: hypothetical protein EOO24_01040 [Comamonadaceae bacterium]|nr:MAG: hypothetical protein EOO24_01040 [Comamonadaceae bacterium]